MALQAEQHIFKGMQRDLSKSKFSNEFAYDAKNIRLTAREDGTLLSVTNEKGTKEIPLIYKEQTIPAILDMQIIGHEVLPDCIILFGIHDDGDTIYKLEYKETYFEISTIYKSESLHSLGFDVNYPIESISVIESEDVKKVYWVDGKNQPRVINIAASDEIRSKWNDNSFDFVQNLKLEETITVTRNSLANGVFAAGTIQYAFTYYNKYGQESNIFYTTPLNYTSHLNRGGKPDDKISNSFDIEIKGVDTNFDFLRIYSIHRTSIDATTRVLKVIDLPVNGTTLKYTDNGTIGEAVDPTELLYIGGEAIAASTITQKDNTLFLGDITINRLSIPDKVKENVVINPDVDILDDSNSSLRTTLREVFNTTNFIDDYYSYTNFLSAGYTAGFKCGENYRLGIQFQHKTGKWSEPVYIGDYIVSDSVRPSLDNDDNLSILKIPQIEFDFDLKYYFSGSDEVNTFMSEYKRVRPIVVLPQLHDRRIVLQGMLCPTVFNMGNRKNGTPFSQSSWFLRPNLPWNVDTSKEEMNNDVNVDKGAWVEFRHHYGTFTGNSRGAEIQNTNGFTGLQYNLTDIQNKSDFIDNFIKNYSDLFLIDQSILTFHSPDIEYDESIQALDYSQLQLRIVGTANFTSSIGDIDIQTSSPTINPKATGFVHKTLGVERKNALAARSLVAGLFYKDWLVDDKNSTKYGYYSKQTYENGWMVYPWQKSGSINNDINRTDGAKSSVLSKKKISNLKFSDFNTWFTKDKYWYAKGNDEYHNGITDLQLFNSNEVSLIKIPVPENSLLSSINYYGNVDTLLVSNYQYTQYVGGFSKDSDLNWIDSSFDAEVKGLRDLVSDIGDIGDLDSNVKESRDPVRMKYKSSPHFVFGLNYSSKTGSQIILPTLKDSNNNALNVIEDTVKPFWITKEISTPAGEEITVKWIDESKDSTPRPSITGWAVGDLLIKEYTGELYKCVSIQGIEQESIKDNFVKVDLFQYLNNIFVGKHASGVYYYYKVSATNGRLFLEKFADSTEPDSTFGVKQEILDVKTVYPYLFIAELYREPKELLNIFGGKTEDAFKSNQWIPAGEPMILDGTNSIVLKYTYGDTWYQRYDCLKTYPFTMEDENSVVEIGSFMCETRTNIDGRSDRNRGQVSNLTMSNTNFNLSNPVYSQKDNFFNYRILDKDFYSRNKFGNTITWTKEKQPVADIDIWTNVTMASTLDLDGDKGNVTSLITYNNEIFCFQEKGFSNILFNSRVQIPVSDGVPIEISNGYKVDGKRYISDFIGCKNKWSIVETPNGLIFIDGGTNSINLYNGQLSCLSDNLGFSSWMLSNDNQKIWNPSNFEGFISYYDKTNGDIYFTNKDYCLCYSEALAQFTSFMSYERIYPMINFNNKLYSFNDAKMWEHFTGDYNMFYNKYQPYYITFIANSNATVDKIFNNIEFRADSWEEERLLNNRTFDSLEVWNEYQHGSSCLDFRGNNVSSLKRKFRVWRANIPRDKHNFRDRIRNTWAYIKLGMNIPNTWKTEFHDVIVHYFM